MKYEVLIISDAQEDLFEIYKYVATHDSINKADYLPPSWKKPVTVYRHLLIVDIFLRN